jgi:hypothetical protein
LALMLLLTQLTNMTWILSDRLVLTPRKIIKTMRTRMRNSYVHFKTKVNTESDESFRSDTLPYHVSDINKSLK